MSETRSVRPDPFPAIIDAGIDPRSDTIVAIATPPGRGGIGVVRLSGPRSRAIAGRMFRPAGGDGLRLEDDGRAIFGRVVGRDGTAIDHGYLVVFHPPRSFTGEVTAEIWTHGSPAALRRLVQEAVGCGARPATPGEYTLRAFLNGRIDITRAEAIRDLIEARTAHQAQVAFEQVQGRIAHQVDRLKERLASLVARVEAAIEFSEEPEADRFLPAGGATGDIEGLLRDVRDLAGTYERGRRIRDGVSVTLAGAPNVGKSSLFNRLLEEERAIVTDVPGTTRDMLEETVELGGIPVVLRDTAGLFEAEGAVDVEAVRRSRAALSGADLQLVVLDWARPMNAAEEALLDDEGSVRRLVVVNKVDCPAGLGKDRILYLRKRHGALEVSARTGEGISFLRGRIAEEAGRGSAEGGGAFLTSVRQRDLLLRAAVCLERAAAAGAKGIGEEYLVVDLKQGLDHLGEITGEVGVEGIYERIFSSFCIGK